MAVVCSDNLLLNFWYNFLESLALVDRLDFSIRIVVDSAVNFVPSSRDELKRVLKRVSKHYTPKPKLLQNPLQTRLGTTPALFGAEILAEWIDFAENIAPLNVNAAEYCAAEYY